MADPHDLYLVSCYLDLFADRLVQASGSVGSADAQTRWQSAAAREYRRHLLDLRVDLRAAAGQAQEQAAQYRALARSAAQSR